jgi:hypothetical protein
MLFVFQYINVLIGCIPNLTEIVQTFFELYVFSTMSQLPTVIEDPLIFVVCGV